MTDDNALYASYIRLLHRLESLPLSATTVSDDEIFVLVEICGRLLVDFTKFVRPRDNDKPSDRQMFTLPHKASGGDVELKVVECRARFVEDIPHSPQGEWLPDLDLFGIHQLVGVLKHETVKQMMASQPRALAAKGA